MELVSDDVKSVALAKIQAVKDLDGALALAETVVQEATLTLKAARLTQVLLIEWGPQKDKIKHCNCFSRSFCFAHGLHADKKYFPKQKARSSMQNVGNLICKHDGDFAVRSLKKNVLLQQPPAGLTRFSRFQGDRGSQGSAHRSTARAHIPADISTQR